MVGQLFKVVSFWSSFDFRYKRSIQIVSVKGPIFADSACKNIKQNVCEDSQGLNTGWDGAPPPGLLVTITECSGKDDVGSKPSVYEGVFGSLKSIDGLCVIMGLLSAGARSN